MIKRLFVTLVTIVVLVGGIGFVFASMIHTLIADMSHQAMPPTPVTAMTLHSETWQPTLTSVGSLTAVQGVIVSAQLDGTVVGINFQPGTSVKAGDLLVQMDVGPEQAQLAAAKAALNLAQVNLRRSHQLLENNTISQSQLDTDQATEQQDVAQVANIQAVIDKKTIRAPFAGKLGIRQVDLGQTLKAGDPIVSLQALNPIYADFFLPQDQLSQVASGLPVDLTCDAFPGQKFEGKITTINPDIDAATRNIHVQATLENADGKLRPGLFVDLSVVLPEKDTVIAIPQTAVLYAPYGDSVFVIEGGKAVQKFVRLGTTKGDFVAVTKGLEEGDQVITSGAFKLQPGISVVVNNALAPDAQLAPKPNDT
ncbi:MAG TPA: efflux RND transporter periplasmic adaptor subunit [Opitutaceae bacterium]|jgi:membrane fusion protein (multidrug efflux system)